jgi:hypothetical protein
MTPNQVIMIYVMHIDRIHDYTKLRLTMLYLTSLA